MIKDEYECIFCLKPLDAAETYTFSCVTLCRDCLEKWTVVCECCGKRMWKENAEIHDGRTLCFSCYNENYTHCCNCGRLIHADDAHYEDFGDDPYCASCFYELEDNRGDGIIEDYNYKPEPVFYGSGPLFLGVELEIDDGGESGDKAERLMDIANVRDERLYCKHDGSIDDGFELVSHPMTLDYHQSVMPWREILSAAVSMGYRSHQTSTCGLHVHVSRSAFGKDHETQEKVIARIVYFVENHWNELLRFSRRTEANINHWASRYGISENTQDTYKKAKDKDLGRYVAVNLENDATIEFRLFRGTLRYETFTAVLQLVDKICRTCIRLSDKELEGLSWSTFVLGIDKDKTNLLAYLKSRQLYVNKKTPEGEEL